MSKQTTITRKATPAKQPASDLSTVDGVLAAMAAKRLDTKEGGKLLVKLAQAEAKQTATFGVKHDAKYPQPAIVAKVLGSRDVFQPLSFWLAVRASLADLDAAIAEAKAMQS